jgi:hypothetical protein
MKRAFSKENVEKVAYSAVALTLVGTCVGEHVFPHACVELLFRRSGLLDADFKLIQDEWRLIGGKGVVDVEPVWGESHATSCGKVLVFPHRFGTLGRARARVAWSMSNADATIALDAIRKWGPHDLPITEEEVRVQVKAQLINILYGVSLFEYGAQLAVLASSAAVCLARNRFLAAPILLTLAMQHLTLRASTSFCYGKLSEEERKTLQSVFMKEFEQRKLLGGYGNDYMDLGRLWLSTRIKMLA